MSYLPLAVFIILVVATASTGAIFSPGAWYDRLEKPSWTPPDWAFPVVWSVLYLMIAIAGWLVWEKAGFGLAIVLWGLQLFLNGAWSWLFFGRRRMDQAFADVTLLWITIAAFVVVAWPISPLAASLFLPYLLWVSIAAALNWTVWRMNPEVTAS
ncbi:MAG: TspO/MBR family protein [Pseudomonadota bacterium]